MIAIRALEVVGFRNLAAQTISLTPRFNVVAGENGQGKTNLLEAIYLVCTSRSFRTPNLGELPAHDRGASMVRASIVDGRDLVGDAEPPAREQRLDIVDGRRAAKIDGKRPKSLAAFALATPVVLFEPASLALSQGAAGERRKLLDRVAVHLAARSGGAAQLLADAEGYRRAHLQRRRALEIGADARTVVAYEALMASHGCRITRARAAAAEAIGARTIAAFEAIARTHLALTVRYASRGADDEAAFAELLATRRMDDARRGTATSGPHLDDLALGLAGRPARQVASQGQHRALVLALKTAELEAIASAREVAPILLLDDVSSELDPTRNAALFSFLHAQVGQVVLTTTRPELIEIDRGRNDFFVRDGVIEPRPRSA
jgi:DNA replication and repair protein RecF